MPRKKPIDSVFSGAKRVKTDNDLQQAREHLERNQQLREEYARRWANVTIVQLLVTFALIIAQGCRDCPWKLSDPVIIAFLGATSLNTLSVVLAISKGLFNVPKN